MKKFQGQEEYFGFGSIKNLDTILHKESYKEIFLVTGHNSYKLSGSEDILKEIFQKNNIRFTRFCNFSSNPKEEEIRRGFKIFNQNNNNYDLIIAVGGGSCIDVSKKIKLDYYEETKQKIPLIAIPTTAGSGSEATYFIVYYKGKKKQSSGNLEITLPEYTIVDPQFTMSLPKKIAAATGIDALGQSIESYWSINSNKQSKEFSKQAIKCLINNLEISVNSTDPELKKQAKYYVMAGANLAGKAINITKTTACHSIAYPMTSYFRVLHGHAVGLTLGQMLIFNSFISGKDCADFRGPDYVKKTTRELTFLLGGHNEKEAARNITSLMHKIGLETRLSKLGINERRKNIIIKEGFKLERVKNNPRKLTLESLRDILDRIS